MSFHVGQKVVCVNDKPASNRLKKGCIYTVAEVFDGVGITLVELPKRNGYHFSRFRPIQERKTDISFAHEILRKVSRKDRVRA